MFCLHSVLLLNVNKSPLVFLPSRREKARDLKTGFVVPQSGTRKKLESKNISINFLKVCFCSGGFAAPNRRLLDRKLIFDFQKPFDFVPKYTEKCERSPATDGASDLSAVALAKAGPTNCLQNSQCLSWSQLLNEVRTFFEQNPE